MRLATPLAYVLLMTLWHPANSMVISREDALKYAQQAGQAASYIDATATYSQQGASLAVDPILGGSPTPGVLKPLQTPPKVNFDAWTPVTLPLSSGASCGNGSPYTFYLLKRSLPQSLWQKFLRKSVQPEQDLTVMFEGGGACNDFGTCSGEGNYGASNSKGLPYNYIGESNPRFATRQWIDVDGYGSSANGLENKIYSSLVGTHFAKNEHLQTKDASQIFLPYCTGDLHIGSKLAAYQSADNKNQRLQYHAGLKNTLVALAYAKELLPEVTGNLVVTGYSAGGIGATLNYALVRKIFSSAATGTLVSDSGPVFSAPFNYVADDATYRRAPAGTTVFGDFPAAHLYRAFMGSWGLAATDGLLVRLRLSLSAFTAKDIGTVYAGIKSKYPKDKVAILAFQSDSFLPVYVYESFMPPLEKKSDPQKNKQAVLDRLSQLQQLWGNDLYAIGQEFRKHGYSRYLPLSRGFYSSHCVTIGDFSATRIAADWNDLQGRSTNVPADQRYENAGIFIQRFLQDRIGAPAREVVSAWEYGYTGPLSSEESSYAGYAKAFRFSDEEIRAMRGLSPYITLAEFYRPSPRFHGLPSVNLWFYPEYKGGNVEIF